jgi:predicted SAM-dependent methyltransferase
MDGYINIDISDGKPAYPIDYLAEDSSLDEIRASHILEHFSHRETSRVLKHWVKKLRAGGKLKIAVPDFRYLCNKYVSGVQLNFMSYIMGGHTDEYDYHKSIFDKNGLTSLMINSGLKKIRKWQSDNEDASSLEISLNLEGIK